MTTLEMIAQKAKDLTPEKQREVLDFLDFLRARDVPQKPRRSAAGLLADLGVDLSDEDIDQARREMWSDFPHSYVARFLLPATRLGYRSRNSPTSDSVSVHSRRMTS